MQLIFQGVPLKNAPYDFSFSGLKSAVLNYLNRCRMQGQEIVAADIAASFQRSVVEVLVEHAIAAAKDYHMDKYWPSQGAWHPTGHCAEGNGESLPGEWNSFLLPITHPLYGQRNDDWHGCLLRV